jgi:hypothetical protein
MITNVLFLAFLGRLMFCIDSRAVLGAPASRRQQVPIIDHLWIEYRSYNC